MQIFLLLLSLSVGIGVWYLFFYRRYENKELIHELRKHNLDLKYAFQECDRDRLEYEQQNIILKEEITLLYQKNDDLTHVVSELSRYYYHMRKISDKMSELSDCLQQPLEDLDSKISPYLRGKSYANKEWYDDYKNDDEFIYRLPDDDRDAERDERQKLSSSQAWFF